jgi:hypothetical protein
MNWEIVSTTLISTAVFAAAIAAIANVVIAIMSNNRLRVIERKHKMTEIEKYRYTHLYDIILNWHNYSTNIESEDKSADTIATINLFNGILDNKERYNLVKPLISSKYADKKQEIESIIDRGDNIILQYVLATNEENEKTNDIFKGIIKELADCSEELEKELREMINQQLEELIDI